MLHYFYPFSHLMTRVIPRMMAFPTFFTTTPRSMVVVMMMTVMTMVTMIMMMVLLLVVRRRALQDRIQVCTDECRRIWRGLRERVRDALRDSVRRADVPRAGRTLKRAGCASSGRRDREGGALVLAASERFGRRCRRAVARYVPPKSGRAADQDEDEQPDDPDPARHGRRAALRLLEPRARSDMGLR